MEGSGPYLQLLAKVPAFAGFDTGQLQALYRCCTLKVLAKGELASVAGQRVDDLAIVVSGRMVAREGERFEAGRGETVEAEAFFAGRPARSTAAALRETVLLTVSLEDLADAFRTAPNLLGALLLRLAGGSGQAAPKGAALSRLAVAAAGSGGELEPGVKEALLAGLESVAEVRVLGRHSFGAGMPGALALDSPEIAHWLQEQELEFDLTIIPAGEADLDYAKEAIEEADGVLFIASGKDPGLSALEKHAIEVRGPENCRLILNNTVKNAADWIEPRHYACAQAVDFNSPEAVRLLGQALTGRGNSFAVSSAGVYAASILGALEAFEAHGLTALSLAAAGSAILPAGLLACGKLSAAAAIFKELANPVLWKRSSRADSGLYDPAPLDNFLVGALQGLEFGTASRPLAAVSRSLSAGSPEVHSAGRLNGAVRAGIVPPGILPPLILDGGDILVSGESDTEALLAAAGGLSFSPVSLVYADAPPLGVSPMSYRNLTGSTLFRLTHTVDKRLRLETVLGVRPFHSRPSGARNSFAIPIPAGIMPMDWPLWQALRDAAYEWASRELEGRKMASRQMPLLDGAA
jgi:CRP-like cAMP-binding protein